MIQAWHSVEPVPNNNTHKHTHTHTHTAYLNTVVYCQHQRSVSTVTGIYSCRYEHHFWSSVNSQRPGSSIDLTRLFILSVSLTLLWLHIQTSQVLGGGKEKNQNNILLPF